MSKQYIVKGEGKVSLGDRDFVAAGGEKKVYKKNGVGYAIYDPPSKMIPVAKIQELAVLSDPRIIKPEKVIMKGNDIVGHTMKFVENTTPIIKLFTKAFRQRNKITPEMMIKLVKKLQQLVSFVHSKDILIVDLNEMNWLANTKFDDLYGIDVNSYQTKHYPATAIMDSIRDRHMASGVFTQETDWFSFAIVAFQMLIGIHPYKGKHPDFEHLALDERINARMLKNISVFDKKTRIPKACFPFDAIPNGLKQWMVALFEKSDRMAPPNDYDAIVHIASQIKEVIGTGLFEITEMGVYDSEIISYYKSFDKQVVCTENSIYVNNRSQPWTSLPKIGFVCQTNTPICLTLDQNNNTHFVNLNNGSNIDLKLSADAILDHEGRLYLQQGKSILEVNFKQVGNNILAGAKPIAQVLDVLGSTKIFDGVVMQNLLGRWYVSIMPVSGRCYQMPLSELDNCRIIDAKFINKVLMVITEKDSKYNRLVFRLNNDYNSYDIRTIENITYTGLNFTVADHGVCVCINEDEKIEIFSNKKGSSQIKILEDPEIDNAWKLFHDGSSILFANGKKLYRISIKGK